MAKTMLLNTIYDTDPDHLWQVESVAHLTDLFEGIQQGPVRTAHLGRGYNTCSSV